MRSYEDRWNWLRDQLTEDHAAATDLADATADAHAATILRGKAAYAVTALRYMDELDRANGPIA